MKKLFYISTYIVDDIDKKSKIIIIKNEKLQY